MKKSETKPTEKLNIYQKLLRIQSAVKGLSKDKQSHNYGYVTGNKLLSFIKPLMDEHSLILKQEIISIDNERQDYMVVAKKWTTGPDGKNISTEYDKPKSEILSKVMMRFTWIDAETGEKDENLFGANGQNDWEKGLGSALTYGERYFLLKFFHIATDEDDIDNPDRKPQEKEVPTTQAPPPAQPKTEPKPKPKMTAEVYDKAIASEDSALLEKALKAYDMTDDQQGNIVLRIEELKARVEEPKAKE